MNIRPNADAFGLFFAKKELQGFNYEKKYVIL